MAVVPEPQPQGSPGPPWWEPVVELVVHVVLGSLLFAIIFTPAILLDLGLAWLRNNYEISGFLTGLLTATKYFIASLDALLYVAWMVNLSWLFLGRLRWHNEPHE